MSDTALRLVGYVLTPATPRTGIASRAVQRQQITAWARANGHWAVAWCEDEADAGRDQETLDRPGTCCVLERIEAGQVDGVASIDLACIAPVMHIREAFLNMVWQRRARVFTVGRGEVERADPTEPTRLLVRQVLDAMAQLERMGRSGENSMSVVSFETRAWRRRSLGCEG